MPGKPSSFKESGNMSMLNVEDKVCQWLEDRIGALVENDMQKHVRTFVGIFRLSRQDLVQDIKEEQHYSVEAKKFINCQPSMDDLRKSVLKFEFKKLLSLTERDASHVVEDLFATYKLITQEEKNTENDESPQSSSPGHPAAESNSEAEPVTRSEQETSYATAFPALPPKGSPVTLPSPPALGFWQQRTPLSSKPSVQPENKIHQDEASAEKAPTPSRRFRSNGKENEVVPVNIEPRKKPLRSKDQRSKRESSVMPSSLGPKSAEESQYCTTARNILLQVLRVNEKPHFAVPGSSLEENQQSRLGLGDSQQLHSEHVLSSEQSEASSRPIEDWFSLDALPGNKPSLWDPAHITECPWWESLSSTAHASQGFMLWNQRSVSEPHPANQTPVVGSSENRQSVQWTPSSEYGSSSPPISSPPHLTSAIPDPLSTAPLSSHLDDKPRSPSRSRLPPNPFDFAPPGSQGNVPSPPSIANPPEAITACDKTQYPTLPHTPSSYATSVSACTSTSLDFQLGLTIWNKNHVSKAEWPISGGDSSSLTSTSDKADDASQAYQPPEEDPTLPSASCSNRSHTDQLWEEEWISGSGIRWDSPFHSVSSLDHNSPPQRESPVSSSTCYQLEAMSSSHSSGHQVQPSLHDYSILGHNQQQLQADMSYCGDPENEQHKQASFSGSWNEQPHYLTRSSGDQHSHFQNRFTGQSAANHNSQDLHQQFNICFSYDHQSSSPGFKNTQFQEDIVTTKHSEDHPSEQGLTSLPLSFSHIGASKQDLPSHSGNNYHRTQHSPCSAFACHSEQPQQQTVFRPACALKECHLQEDAAVGAVEYKSQACQDSVFVPDVYRQSKPSAEQEVVHHVDVNYRAEGEDMSFQALNPKAEQLLHRSSLHASLDHQKLEQREVFPIFLHQNPPSTQGSTSHHLTLDQHEQVHTEMASPSSSDCQTLQWQGELNTESGSSENSHQCEQCLTLQVVTDQETQQELAVRSTEGSEYQRFCKDFHLLSVAEDYRQHCLWDSSLDTHVDSSTQHRHPSTSNTMITHHSEVKHYSHHHPDASLQYQCPYRDSHPPTISDRCHEKYQATVPSSSAGIHPNLQFNLDSQTDVRNQNISSFSAAARHRPEPRHGDSSQSAYLQKWSTEMPKNPNLTYSDQGQPYHNDQQLASTTSHNRVPVINDWFGLRNLASVFCQNHQNLEDSFVPHVSPVTQSFLSHSPNLSGSSCSCFSHMCDKQSCDGTPSVRNAPSVCFCEGACNCSTTMSSKICFPGVEMHLPLINKAHSPEGSHDPLQFSPGHLMKCASDSDLYCVPSEKSAFKQVSSLSCPVLVGPGMPQKIVHGFRATSWPQICRPCLVEDASEEQLNRLKERRVKVIRPGESDSSSEYTPVSKPSFLSNDLFGGWCSWPEVVPDFLVKESKETQTMCEDIEEDFSVLPASSSSSPAPAYEEKIWKDLHPLTEEDIQRENLYAMVQAHLKGQAPEWSMLDVAALEEYDQSTDFPMIGKSSANLLIPQHQAVYVKDLETAWLHESRRHHGKGKDKARRPLHPNKPCSFYLEGCCYRSDCKFSHDISTITCHFWEEGQCFKGDLCPFLHGYHKGTDGSDRAKDFDMTVEDFPELARKDAHLNNAPTPKKRKNSKKNSGHRLQLPRGT